MREDGWPRHEDASASVLRAPFCRGHQQRGGRYRTPQEDVRTIDPRQAGAVRPSPAQQQQERRA